MTLAEQVGALESAGVVAGVLGSAFHAVLLTASPPPCVHFCTARVASPFIAQDQLLDSEAIFVPTVAADRFAPTGPGRPNPYRLLVPETVRALAALTSPSLLDDPRLEALAYPERQWSVVEPTAGGEPPRGRAFVDRAVARTVLDPQNASARMILGAELEAEGRVEDALEQYAAVANLDAGYAYGKVRTARLLWSVGRHVDAAAAAREVLALDPGNAEAARYLAAAPSAG